MNIWRVLFNALVEIEILVVLDGSSGGMMKPKGQSQTERLELLSYNFLIQSSCNESFYIHDSIASLSSVISHFTFTPFC